MDKPRNPYKKGTLKWSIMEGDWEDLTIAQIAEVLDTMSMPVRNAIRNIKSKTGYDVPRARAKRGRKPNE